jgi:hypothetical protein
VSVRGRALGWGLVIVALYVAGGIVSGHLSPLARRPLLDGIVPPVPYRWVDPPPELAGSNLPPASGRTRIPIDPKGSAAAFFATDDAQVTLNITKGAFQARPGSKAVEVTIEPVDPASVGALPGRLSIKGNVYLIRATSQPGDRPQRLDASIVAIVTYPALTNDLGNHTLVISPDGKRWERIKTHDQHATKQVNGSLRSLGYLAVASGPLSSAGPDGVTPPSEGGVPLSILAVVIGAVLLFAGVFILGRGSDQRGGRRAR